MGKCCEKCIYSQKEWNHEITGMVKCEKRKARLYKWGFPCKHYAEAPWWKKAWAKRFFRGEQ